MTIHIILTGPLRPTVEYVSSLCVKLRTIVHDCKLHVVYWKTTESDHKTIASVADTAFALEEPSDEWIASNIRGRTIQQRQLRTIDDWTPRMFKMFHGIQMALDCLKLPNDAIVIRVRTDLYIRNVEIDILNQLLCQIQSSVFYFCPRQTGGNSCDWFGISTADTLRKLYGYTSIELYNQAIQSVFNAEQMIPYNANRYSIQLVGINHILTLAIYRGHQPGFPEIHIYN